MSCSTDLLQALWSALGGPPGILTHVGVTASERGSLPSLFRVSDLAASSIAAAGAAVAELIGLETGKVPDVRVDRRLASMWFLSSLRPSGWQVPPVWHAVAGDYLAADRWIRIHANYPHHRRIALEVLQTPAERKSLAESVGRWKAEDLETSLVAHGGCAAMLRSRSEWGQHPQGIALANEPLIFLEDVDQISHATRVAWPMQPNRPLAGVRVLDLTRVLAGPVSTRFLAGFGAEVLRIDPPDWEEPGIAPEMTIGKRCARLDLRQEAHQQQLIRLLESADVFVHGYRADALDRLGLGPSVLRERFPSLLDVSLNAYGWSGPWRNRRGFDSLVQMSSGIAEAGMRASGREAPLSLPVQALDHATGYIMAAATVPALVERRASGIAHQIRTSLARTAEFLAQAGPGDLDTSLDKVTDTDVSDKIEPTAWGPARRLVPPLCVADAPIHWDYAAGQLGSATAAWHAS